MVEQNTTAEPDLSHLRPLIDGDPIIYRAGFAADGQLKKEYKEQHPDASDDEVANAIQLVDYEGIAKYNAREMLEDITARFRGDAQVFLTGSGNFRESLATILPYKGTRDPLHKPKYYKQLREYLASQWNAHVTMGIEADDAIATEQWRNKDRSTIICTIDKDLDQIPGWHYNYVKRTVHNVSLARANAFLFWQMLEGDRSDNIPGIKGVGEKTIQKAFDRVDWELDKLREIVQIEYQKQYEANWEAAYREVGNLLWMRRLEGQECPLL